MEFRHTSVLLDEVIEYLNIKPDGVYVDGTLGGAGHAGEIVKRLTPINRAHWNRPGCRRPFGGERETFGVSGSSDAGPQQLLPYERGTERIRDR